MSSRLMAGLTVLSVELLYNPSKSLRNLSSLGGSFNQWCKHANS